VWDWAGVRLLEAAARELVASATCVAPGRSTQKQDRASAVPGVGLTRGPRRRRRYARRDAAVSGQTRRPSLGPAGKSGRRARIVWGHPARGRLEARRLAVSRAAAASMDGSCSTRVRTTAVCGRGSAGVVGTACSARSSSGVAEVSRRRPRRVRRPRVSEGHVTVSRGGQQPTPQQRAVAGRARRAGSRWPSGRAAVSSPSPSRVGVVVNSGGATR
jgi:hypothetical protein